MRAKFGVLEETHGVHLRAKFRLDQFILSTSSGDKPQISPSFGGRHFVVSPIGGNLRQLNMAAQLQSTNLIFYFKTNDKRRLAPLACHEYLPLSNGIKIVSVLQRLHGEIGRTRRSTP